MPFTIVCQDITKLKCDAIVNAANTALQAGGGVCGAIFRQAGKDQLQEACNQLAPIDVGQAVITPGFNLPSHYIIHTVGPVYQGGKHGERGLLAQSYRSALQLALEYELSSIAFPLISSGIYGYPKREALAVATAVFREFLSTYPALHIVLAVIDRSTIEIDQQLLGAIETHLATLEWRQDPSEFSTNVKLALPSTTLDAVTLTQRANLPFNFLQTEHYVGKSTAVALAVALQLSLTETRSFLGNLGLFLSGETLFDHIVEFCLSQRILDVFAINELLFHYKQPLLGEGISSCNT